MRIRLNAKEVIFHPKNGKFIFPAAPIRGESHFDFLEESEGSLPPPHNSHPDAGEAMNDFWSMSGNFKCRHHLEPRVKTLLAERRIIPFSTEIH